MTMLQSTADQGITMRQNDMVRYNEGAQLTDTLLASVAATAPNISEPEALFALLAAIDKRRDTWNTIANNVQREGSAARLWRYEFNPKIYPLQEFELSEMLQRREQALEALQQSKKSAKSASLTPPLTLFPEKDAAEREIAQAAAQVEKLHTRQQQLLDGLNTAKRNLQTWQEQGLNFLTVIDPDFPNAVREVVDVPPFLFYKGELRQDEQAVSVVGSRHADESSLQFARDTAAMLVSQQYAVIAGLAEGIDTAALDQALREGGRAVAFIGTGINRSYPPSNYSLQQAIEERGVVFSQFYPDQPPTKSTFPGRNATMSAYGMASVIVSATEYSGTRIQARQAQRHGRPIILRESVLRTASWAREYEGKPGVYIASSVDEVRQVLEGIASEQALFDTTMVSGANTPAEF